MILIEVIIGAFLALLALRLFHYDQEEVEKGFVAFALVVAAMIYAVFATVALFTDSADLSLFLQQVAGVGIFFGLAYLGVTRSMWFIAVGWLGHMAWDASVHVHRSLGPAFYPPVCVGFDLVIAIYVLWRFRLLAK